MFSGDNFLKNQTFERSENFICEQSDKKENKMERQTVKIIDMKQAGLYIKNGLQPVKIYYDNKLVMEFDKEKSNPLYTKWLNRTLK